MHTYVHLFNTEFVAFPRDTAVSNGFSPCFLCDYPELEQEAWNPTCPTDQDNMCMCSINDIASGVELCFTNFISDCTNNYSCSVNVQSDVCTAGPVQIVWTGM